MTEPSKTRTSFYRRLYVAWLISQGTDTIPAIMAATVPAVTGLTPGARFIPRCSPCWARRNG